MNNKSPTANFFNTKWKYKDYFTFKYWHVRKCAKNFSKNFKIDQNVALQVQDLNSYFTDFQGNLAQVLKRINFTFLKNKIYCIIGNSGSGKTTLVNHFNGLLKSSEGNIYLIDNQKILFYKRKIRNYKAIRRNISSVMQSPENQLFKETVLKDVAFGPKILGIPKDQVIPISVKALLDLDLGEDFFNSNPFNLSGGQKRKVALAGILAINPKIIIFDEPTVGLDPFSEKIILNLIESLKKQKKTVIVISHNMNNVFKIADHILLLNDGKLIYDAPTFDFFKNKKILTDYDIVTPQIIEVINKLENNNPIYQKLWNIQPRSVDALASAITKIKFNIIKE